MLEVLAFVLPLSLDAFAAAAAIGAIGTITARDRLRISLIFVIFEAGMPLIGLALGNVLARGIGPVAGYLAGGTLIGIGAWMLATSDDDDQQQGNRLAGIRGVALIALGISVSLDELAIGFTIGLARLPVVAVISAIAIQALIAVQAGLAIGTRIGERIRERAEQIAGFAMILLGCYLIVSRIIR